MSIGVMMACCELRWKAAPGRGRKNVRQKHGGEAVEVAEEKKKRYGEARAAGHGDL